MEKAIVLWITVSLEDRAIRWQSMILDGGYGVGGGRKRERVEKIKRGRN